jgi:hypothetical protein
MTGRNQVIIGRVMWWPPWRVSRPWWFKLWRGGDEWCNDSVALAMPLLGALIVFWRPGPKRAMPCGECWGGMSGEERADYLPGGYLEGGVVHQDRADALFALPEA